jgi:alkanesulfonate monooxygenase SsuD/methylene tetrahydromethanopterin reductase-like flavin-dependent oxidoreductase (luciferase family)
VSPLHFGLILPNYGPALAAEELADTPVAAEEVGFDSAWMTDHLIVPSEYAGVYGTSLRRRRRWSVGGDDNAGRGRGRRHAR